MERTGKMGTVIEYLILVVLSTNNMKKTERRPGQNRKKRILYQKFLTTEGITDGDSYAIGKLTSQI